MKSRKNYFRRRRQRLSKRHLCTRCGENPPAKGHKLCESCTVIKKAKREIAPVNATRKMQRARETLALLETARSQLIRRFEHVA